MIDPFSKALVILSPGFPTDEHDTTCLPPIQQFCLLAKEEYPEMHIIVVAFQYPFHKAHYQWNGIEVYAMGGRNRNKLFRLLLWVQVRILLSKLCRQRKIAGILSLWLTETALVGRKFARSHKLRFHAWLQGQDARKENSYVFRSGIKSSEAIAISGFNGSELKINHGIEPFMIAPNGINTSVFPDLNMGERDIDVLGVGSLIPLKNYEAFVRAIHELKKERPQIRAVIAGTGPEERTLSDLIFRLGLQHNLKLMGVLPHPEILKLMNRSKVFLHTSSYEGMSTVTLEALYSGAHVVAFQGLGEEEIENLALVDSEGDLASACANELSKSDQVKRVLVHDMRKTARTIVSLFQ